MSTQSISASITGGAGTVRLVDHPSLMEERLWAVSIPLGVEANVYHVYGDCVSSAEDAVEAVEEFITRETPGWATPEKLRELLDAASVAEGRHALAESSWLVLMRAAHAFYDNARVLLTLTSGDRRAVELARKTLGDESRIDGVVLQLQNAVGVLSGDYAPPEGHRMFEWFAGEGHLLPWPADENIGQFLSNTQRSLRIHPDYVRLLVDREGVDLMIRPLAESLVVMEASTYIDSAFPPL